ncbi:MAG: hypothetical protein RL748_2925, partial [Pseudomonadota bacterium]
GASLLGLHFVTQTTQQDGHWHKQHKLALKTSHDLWLQQQQRLELGFSLQRDLRQNSTAAMLSLKLHLGNGRGLRDFAPEEIIFRELRQRRAPESAANLAGSHQNSQ